MFLPPGKNEFTLAIIEGKTFEAPRGGLHTNA